MKHIFLQIQEKLGEVSALKYIDKDWNQLKFEQPPVKWPCALIDVTNISYSQMGQLWQMAEADVEITVANVRLVNSSQVHSSRADSYSVFDIMDGIHNKLHGWHGMGFSKLIRTNTAKVYTDRSSEVYTMTYHTSWRVEGTNRDIEKVQVTPRVLAELE